MLKVYELLSNCKRFKKYEVVLKYAVSQRILYQILFATMMLINSVIHLQIIYLVSNWIAPKEVKCCSLSPLPLRTMHHTVVVKTQLLKLASYVSKKQLLCTSVWCVCTWLPSTGRHQSITAVSELQPKAKRSFSSVQMSVIQQLEEQGSIYTWFCCQHKVQQFKAHQQMKYLLMLIRVLSIEVFTSKCLY